MEPFPDDLSRPPAAHQDEHLRVADVMSPPPELHVGGDTSIGRALAVVRAARVPHLLVLAEDGRCAGLVTEDQLAHYWARLAWTPRSHPRIRDLDHLGPPFAAPDMPATEALGIMTGRKITAWPVINTDGRPIGVVTSHRLHEALDAPPPHDIPAPPPDTSTTPPPHDAGTPHTGEHPG